MKACRKK